MSIVEAGTALSDTRNWVGTPAVNTSNRDGNWVSEAVALNAGEYVYTRKWTPISSGWFVFRKYYMGGSGARNGAAVFALTNSDDEDILRLWGNGTTITLEWWDGSTWAAIGSGWTHTTTNDSVAIEFDLSGSGVLGWYVNGVEVARVTGDYSAADAIGSARLDKWNSGGLGDGTAYSEWICSTDPAMNKRFYCKPPTANGSNTAWGGTYAAIDETGVSVSDSITSTADGNVSTFTAAARPFSSPYQVDAVVLPFYARKSVTGPDQVIPVLRIGGVNYDAGPAVDLGYGYKGFAPIIETDPSTSSPWSLTNANDAALEFGYKSASA